MNAMPLDSAQERMAGAAALWLLVVAAAVVLAGVLAWRLRGSDDPTPARPALSEVVLQIGAIDIRDRELNRFVAWSKSMDPACAASQVRSVTLRDWILPKFVVEQLAKPEILADARAKAERLVLAVNQLGGRLQALRDLGEPYGLEESDLFHPPRRFAPDVAEQVFTTEVGGVTTAVHSAYASVVAGVVGEKIENGIRKRKIVSVSFPYSSGELLRSRVLDAVKELMNGPVWVHPYYRDEFELRFPQLLPTPLREPTFK